MNTHCCMYIMSCNTHITRIVVVLCCYDLCVYVLYFHIGNTTTHIAHNNTPTTTYNNTHNAQTHTTHHHYNNTRATQHTEREQQQQHAPTLAHQYKQQTQHTTTISNNTHHTTYLHVCMFVLYTCYMFTRAYVNTYRLLYIIFKC